MGLHRLLSFTTAVPDPDGLAAFYGELGLGGGPDDGVHRERRWRRGPRGRGRLPPARAGGARLRRTRGPRCVARRLTDGGAAPSRRRQRAPGRRPGESGRARGSGGRTRPHTLPRLVGGAERPWRHGPGGRTGPRRVRRAPTAAAPRPPGDRHTRNQRDPGPAGTGHRPQAERRDRRGYRLPAVLAGPPQRGTGRLTGPVVAALLLGVRRHRPRRPQRVCAVAARPIPSHVGAGSAFRRLELLLVPARSGGLLSRALLGPGPDPR